MIVELAAIAAGCVVGVVTPALVFVSRVAKHRRKEDEHNDPLAILRAELAVYERQLANTPQTYSSDRQAWANRIADVHQRMRALMEAS